MLSVISVPAGADILDYCNFITGIADIQFDLLWFGSQSCYLLHLCSLHRFDALTVGRERDECCD